MSSTGQRIRSARLAAGLTMRELSVRLDKKVSHTAIAKYESDMMLPRGEVLNLLAGILNVSRDYFFGKLKIQPDEIILRKIPSITVRQMDLLKERIYKQLCCYLRIERVLGIDPVFRNPLENYIIQRAEDVEEAVEKLRNQWKTGEGGILSICDLLENHEVKIFVENVTGLSHSLSGQAPGPIPLIVISPEPEPEQLCSAVLYEFGCMILKFGENLPSKEKEKSYRRFSSAFLIPKETFQRETGFSRSFISTPELIRIKETFGISVREILKRALTLGIISRQDYRQYCMRISVDPGEKNLGWLCGREICDRYKTLVFRAASEELIPLKEAAGLLNQNELEFRMESRIM